MKTFKLTDEQAALLTMYIAISSRYREGEIQSCKELAHMPTRSGSPVYPLHQSFAERWEYIHHELEIIRRVIDSARSKKGETLSLTSRAAKTEK